MKNLKVTNLARSSLAALSGIVLIAMPAISQSQPAPNGIGTNDSFVTAVHGSTSLPNTLQVRDSAVGPTPTPPAAPPTASVIHSISPPIIQQIQNLIPAPTLTPTATTNFTFDPSTSAARNFDTFKRPTSDDLVDRDHSLEPNILKALQPDHPSTGTNFNPLPTPKHQWLRAPASLTDLPTSR